VTAGRQESRKNNPPCFILADKNEATLCKTQKTRSGERVLQEKEIGIA
jgi:hypothetical protein